MLTCERYGVRVTSRPQIRVDRSSPVPLYFQVSQQLEEAIHSGELAPGFRLENEIALADRYGLSRPTMRRAIQTLVDKGLLVRKRGVGTQVVHGQMRREVELTSLYDDLANTDQKPTTQVLHNAVEAASPEVAAALGVERGSQVLHLRRLRLARGEPLAVLENWLPEPLMSVGEADLEQQGLYQLMRDLGVHMRIARQRIGARGANADEAKLLGERRNAPLLTMERATYDDFGRAVEWGSHVYRPETYSFEITLIER